MKQTSISKYVFEIIDLHHICCSCADRKAKIAVIFGETFTESWIKGDPDLKRRAYIKGICEKCLLSPTIWEPIKKWKEPSSKNKTKQLPLENFILKRRKNDGVAL